MENVYEYGSKTLKYRSCGQCRADLMTLFFDLAIEDVATHVPGRMKLTSWKPYVKNQVLQNVEFIDVSIFPYPKVAC